MTLPAHDAENAWRDIKDLWQDRGINRLFVTDGKRVGHLTWVAVHELGDSTHLEHGKPINEFQGTNGLVLHVSWYQDGYGPEIGEGQV